MKKSFFNRYLKPIFNKVYRKRFEIAKYSLYFNLFYISYYSINPINKIIEFYSAGIIRFLSEILNSPEVKDTSLNMVEKLFKNSKLIDVQLDQLKKAVKSESVINQSKPFGKEWIIKTVKYPSFISFSNLYFTKIMKDQIIIDKSADLIKDVVENNSVIDKWADTFKEACVSNDPTLDALIDTLTKAGKAALTDDKTKDKFGEACFNLFNSEKFLREIKKHALPYIYE